MPLSSEVREEYLQSLIDNKKQVRTAPLFYKNRSWERGVYQIELKYLIYNRFNDRIATEMSTWRTESHVSPDQYTDEIHEKIAEFIWKSNPGKNKITKENIKERRQRQHGIVTLDGVVVSGNRRLMLISQIPSIRHFDAVILD